MYNSESGKHLYQFYKQKEEILLKNCNVILNKPDFDSFHDFRVSIKRIKAIFRLLDLFTSEFNSSKQFKPFRAVYNPAGKIREAQINLKIIEEYSISDTSKIHFITYSNAQESKSLVKLREKLICIDKKPIDKTRKKLKRYCKEIGEDEIMNKSRVFIKARIESIRNTIPENSDEFFAHQARISLKEISAVLMLLRKMGFKGFNRKLLESIKTTEDKLGIWHDKIVLSDSINKFIQSVELPASVVNEYHGIQSIIAIENKKFLQQLNSLVAPTLKKIEKRVISVSDNP